MRRSLEQLEFFKDLKYLKDLNQKRENKIIVGLFILNITFVFTDFELVKLIAIDIRYCES